MAQPEVPPPAVPRPLHHTDDDLVRSVRQLIGEASYPCLGAKSLLRRGGATVRVYPALATPEAAATVAQDLEHFALHPTAAATGPAEFRSFVAVFRGPAVADEVHFERLLWRQLALLSELDEHAWSPDVSSDPDDDRFAFSMFGTAFFVVGLHPRASRDARRTLTPVLVFNPHDQFERLRASGRYGRMRDTIRRRDETLQGSVNPMVSDHGSVSEARQYSGRRVGPGWRPPAS